MRGRSLSKTNSLTPFSSSCLSTSFVVSCAHIDGEVRLHAAGKDGDVVRQGDLGDGDAEQLAAGQRKLGELDRFAFRLLADDHAR